jgi:hypothetical protein
VKAVRLGVRDGEFRVDRRLTKRLARHLEVADEVVVLAGAGSGLDDFAVVRRVLSADVRVDGVLDAKTVELGLTEAAPDGGLVDLVGVLLSAVNRDNVLDEDVHRLEVEVVLAVERERLLVETVLDHDGRDLLNVETLDALDVVHDATLVGADGGEHEELLEVGVVGEGGLLEDDLLEKLDELRGKVGGEERLDGDRDVLRVRRLGNGGRDDLVDEGALVEVVVVENLRPEFEPSPLDEVTSLVLEHLVVVGDGDELVVAEAFGVGDVGEVRVALLAVLSDDERVVDVVLLEERLRVLVRVDVDLGESVVDGGLLLTGGDLGFEPREDELEAVALLYLVNELIDGNGTGDGREEGLDGVLVAVDVEETADDLGSAGGVDALDVNLDEVG